MDTTFIYALNDPETGECRYVGKTNDLKKTFRRHIRDGRTKTFHKARWIKSLLVRGVKPLLEIIDEVADSEGLPLEAAYIQFFRDEGFDLTNITPGGDCGPSALGRKQTPEWCEAHRARMSGEKNPFFGRKHSPESRKKISDATSGEKHRLFGKYGAEHPCFGLKPTPEKTVKVSQKLKGRKRPQSFSEALSKARIGMKLPGARSKYRGVSWKNEDVKWHVRIKVTGKRIYLGRFSNEIEAAKAYDVAAKKYHGANAKLNFPD